MPSLTIPSSSRRLARSAVISRAGLAYAPALIFLFASAHFAAVEGERWILPRVQDDAFYYLAIARNIALHGHSELAPGVATNGYQPLWMLATLGAGSLFGFTLATLKALELAVIFVGLVLLIRLLGVRNLLASFCYTMGLWYVLETCAINGMESSLLFPGLVLFIAAFVSREAWLERRRALWLFVASALCFGARIDAALVLLPMLAVAPVTGRAKLAVVGALASCGLVYCAFNYAVFGAMLPVSGAVKSLGGFQLNHTYLRQLANELDPARVLRMRSAATPYLTAVATLALALLLRRGRPQLQLPLALVALGSVGLALAGLRLVFFSSWGVWPWYGYPTLLFSVLAIWIVENAGPPPRALRLAQVILGFSLAITQLQSALVERPAGFAGVSRQFIAEHAATLGSEPVAMGDRAGSFGFDYPGGVYHLEGLVNDAAFVAVLRTPTDLRAHLCRAGVPTVVSYEAPLGDYREHRVEALRRQLTHQRGPSLTVRRAEEIASFQDLTQFSEPNSRIYAWRLDCDAENENAAGSETRPRVRSSSPERQGSGGCIGMCFRSGA